jgi:hypothetical protein
MRFSIALILFTLFAPILAAPVPGGGGVKGKGAAGSGSGGDKKSIVPAPAAVAKAAPATANPKDFVIVKPAHYIGGDSGKGDTQDKPRPAIVVHHDPATHELHVVPLGSEHPAGVPTIPADALGIPAAAGSLVSLGPPKVIHLDNVKQGKSSLTDDQFDQLHSHLVKSGAVPPTAAPESEKKKIGKRQLERREVYGVHQRY